MNAPILLIHPEKRFSRELKRLFFRHNFFVMIAPNENDALDAISAGIFDAAIIIWSICNNTAAEFSSMLKANCSTTRIVVIDDGTIDLSEYANLCTRYQFDLIVPQNPTTKKLLKIIEGNTGANLASTYVPALSPENNRHIGSSSTTAPLYVPADGQRYVTVSPRGATEETPTRRADSRETMDYLRHDEETANKLMELSREYQRKLPGELSRLKRDLIKAREAEGNDEIIMKIRRQTHTLSGTAGTLGFVEVTEIIVEINKKIKEIEETENPSRQQWQDIMYLVDRAISTPERTSLVPMEAMEDRFIGTMLLVSVSQAFIRQMEMAAGRVSVQILSIGTPREFDQALASQQFDGILFDADNTFMPPGDMIQAIRQREGHRAIPMSITSSEDSVENRIAAVSSGVNRFLVKPLSDETIVGLTREFQSDGSTKGARILVVDDDAFFRKHVMTLLESEHLDVVELENPEEILEALELFNPDILLLDVVMPQIDGYQVCKMVKSEPKWKDLPILFLTAQSDAGSRIECFRSGGDDYIQKPCIKEELIARIGVRLERIRLFRDKADKDPLTQLLNRRAFLEHLEMRMTEAKRFDRPLSFCVIDLDKFKSVNDTYGHLAGDQVLATLGKLLANHFRSVDIRCRWGGEEFAVVFYNEKAASAKTLLQAMKETLKRQVFTGESGQTFQVSFSGGIATFPEDATTFDDLFKLADALLYKAKELGRDYVATLADK